MKKTYDIESVETAEPIEYIDSITASSYINAINTIAMKTIRTINSEAVIYGSSDITPYLVESELDLMKKDAGLWIIKTELPNSYRLSLYNRIAHMSIFYTSYENRKICDFYYVMCKRTVPKIITEPNRYDLFESELSSAVYQFKNRAER